MDSRRTGLAADGRPRNAPGDHRSSDELWKLMEEYVAVCNRILIENGDRLLFRQVRKLNAAVLGEVNFVTVVYGRDPDDVLGEFTIRFDPDDRLLRLAPSSATDEVAFRWKASRAYLEDVAIVRPDWYAEHPAMLDWMWFSDRTRDELEQRFPNGDGVTTLLAGFGLGALFGVVVTRTVASR
jgi:hypothetical protein